MSVDKSRWKPLFKDFISNLSIDSKELGICSLNDVLYGAQNKFLDEICDGLEQGVHHFVILKARQLGISTISLAIDLFWLMVHDGLQGALITDNEGNRDKFRIILERYIGGLPKELRVGIKKHNRNNLVFANGSVLDYLVAGTRKTGSLGRGRALNFVHATECSSWGDDEGVASLMASMAEEHPNRLYIFESTAKGLDNPFWKMWTDAEKDHETQRTIFLGWATKEVYRVPKGGNVWNKYWNGSLHEDEKELIRINKEKYNVTITQEQVVWWRWKQATQLSGENMMEQEFPWTAEQAFIATGRGFFNRREITKDTKVIYAEAPIFDAYRYHLGNDFLATEVENIKKTIEVGGHVTYADMDLKIWEHPKQGAYYAMGVDPAYGRSDNKDRHCIQIWRCYADIMVQVAEYCTDSFESRQVAWVMCHLAGMYRNCMINLEITGPGVLCMQELDHLKQLLVNGYLSKRAEESGMVDIFNAVSWYLYHRPDSMGSGYVYGWQTTTDSKYRAMNQMRDEYAKQALKIRSIDLLEEMLTIVQDGSEIRASSHHKDDRVFATALAIEAWMKWIRPPLISGEKTFARVTEDEEKKPAMMQSMVAGIITDTFKRKDSERIKAEFDQAWENT